MNAERRVINGIRVILCGRADWAWDPGLQDFVSTNNTYVLKGLRDPRGIRWQLKDGNDSKAVEELAGHREWLKGIT
jgi:hypothetical protein